MRRILFCYFIEIAFLPRQWRRYRRTLCNFYDSNLEFPVTGRKRAIGTFFVKQQRDKRDDEKR